jgi:hypothetical protein
VIHFCEAEPLGRIFLEAIDFGLPLIGFNSAGIGEIGKLTGLDTLLVNLNDANINAAFIQNLEKVKANWLQIAVEMETQRAKAEYYFNINSYTSKVDSLLTA